MERVITVAALLVAASLSAFAQLSFPGKENQRTIYGGENGNNFAAIYSTGSPTRQAAISQAVDFLVKYNLIKKENSAAAKKAVKEYDDTQSEFTVPVSLRFGWHGTAPVMGAVSPLAPVIINADLMFQFFDEGKVRLIIKNFRDYSYVDYAYRSKSMMGNKTTDGILNDKEKEAYKNYMLAPVMKDGLGKAITAFLVWGNKGLDNMADFYRAWDDYLSNIDIQLELAKKLADGGYYMFGSPEEVLAAYRDLASKDDLNVPSASLDTFEKDIAAEKLGFVYELFWRRDIKVQFDYLFIAVNSFLGGKIEGIAENGEITWELVDDKLLPVDTKLRKKLEKKGQDYFSYYGE